MKIKIEKDIPIPRHELPFGEMEVGDSFLLPAAIPHGSARQMIHQYQKRHAERFSLRRMGDAYRCWRVK